jgi:cell division cycle 2-like protein
VFRARHKSSGKIYALKKLKMEHCPDGFPQTSVREVNVLLSLHHPNIVNVAEVRGVEGGGRAGGDRDH